MSTSSHQSGSSFARRTVFDAICFSFLFIVAIAFVVQPTEEQMQNMMQMMQSNPMMMAVFQQAMSQQSFNK